MVNMAMKPLTNFVLQQVFEILLRDPVDYSIVAYLSDIKTSGLTNEVTMVYPQGGRGNVRIGRGFAHSRHATLNIESATFNMDVLVANTSFLSFNAATDAIKRLSSLLASKLLTLSSGCPLSRNLPNGRR